MIIKYSDSEQDVPQYVQSLHMAAKVLNGCAVHDNCADARAAARFSIAEALQYIEMAVEQLQDIDEQQDELPARSLCNRFVECFLSTMRHMGFT